MRIERNAVAGTMESSDIFISVEPWDSLEVELESVVMRQYGQEIDRVLREVLTELGVETGKVTAKDRGALECVIRARMETAVKRGGVN